MPNFLDAIECFEFLFGPDITALTVDDFNLIWNITRSGRLPHFAVPADS